MPYLRFGRDLRHPYIWWSSWSLIWLAISGCGQASGSSGGRAASGGTSSLGLGSGASVPRSSGPSGANSPPACSGGPQGISLNLFQENPRTSSGNSSLPFTSPLTISMTVPGSISGLEGNCLLQNQRYSITSDTFFPSNIARVVSGNQVFSPSSPEFDQLNSFFYADSLRALLVDTLGAALPGRISIDAHCGQRDNAFYSPGSQLLCLGFHEIGGKKIWAADDADVVIHEAGHSVNNSLASSSVLSSTFESGAIDEAIADYWALTVQDDPELSEWFLGSINPSAIRDATGNHTYPSSLTHEVHDDSRILSELLWDLRLPNNLGKADTDRLVKRALQLLPGTSWFSDFYDAFYDASGPLFLNLSPAKRSLIVAKFTEKGIHRVDSAAGLRLSTSSAPIRVIDDHSSGLFVGGNCNGALDVGETALVLVNLENTSAYSMGAGTATIVSAPAGVSVPSGGGIGEFFRINGGADFVSSLPPRSSARSDAILSAGFLIKATTPGLKVFTLSFRPMFSDPTGIASQSAASQINFSVQVGAAPFASSCAGSSLWP